MGLLEDSRPTPASNTAQAGADHHSESSEAAPRLLRLLSESEPAIGTEVPHEKCNRPHLPLAVVPAVEAHPHDEYMCAVTYDMAHVIYLALCFMILLTAYNSTEALIGPIFKSVGLLGLFLCYSAFAIAYVLAPLLAHALNERVIILFGAAVYCVFIGALQLDNPVVYLFMSFIRGLAGAPMWVAEHVYVNKIVARKPSSAGKYNGTFNSIVCINSVLGNAIISIELFASETSSSDLTAMRPTLVLLFVVAVVALAMFVFIRPADHAAMPTVASRVDTKVEGPHRLTCDTIHNYHPFAILKEPTLRVGVVGYAFAYGFCTAFLTGAVTRHVPDIRWVPVMLVAYGIFLLLSASTTGRVFDRYGWKPLVVMQLVVLLVAWSLTLVAIETELHWLLFVCSVFYGWAAALQSTLISTTIMRCFPDRPAPAVSIANGTQSLGTAACFLLGTVIPYHVLMGLCLVTNVTGVILFSYNFTHHDPDLLRPHTAGPHVEPPKRAAIAIEQRLAWMANAGKAETTTAPSAHQETA